jgi:hypothetical protein
VKKRHVDKLEFFTISALKSWKLLILVLKVAVVKSYGLCALRRKNSAKNLIWARTSMPKVMKAIMETNVIERELWSMCEISAFQNVHFVLFIFEEITSNCRILRYRDSFCQENFTLQRNITKACGKQILVKKLTWAWNGVCPKTPVFFPITVPPTPPSHTHRHRHRRCSFHRVESS